MDFDALQTTVLMESMTQTVALTLLVSLAALLVGLLLGRSGRSTLLAEQERLRSELERAKSQTTEHNRTLARMRRELDTVANLAMTLPHVVRDLNRDDLDPSDVPELILKLANAIFQPRQVLLYGLRAGAGGQKLLTLSAHCGLTEIPEALKKIPIGEGKIGWVASHELDMLKADWEKLARTDSIEVLDNHPLLLADVMGPLVHHTRERQQVLGVLVVGAPQIRPRDEKLMFQMVTNFGSLALVNSGNLKKLRSAAHHDGLTLLLNKRAFLGDVAAQALHKCEMAAKPFSLFIFDIDHFKTYNDTNGHPAGDELLRKLGGMIRRSLRPGDLACRYGGEEFVIAMPDTDRDTARELAEGLRAAIESEPFPHRELQPSGMVSISGGVAAFPKDGVSIAELIQYADQSLYHSKKTGRNRITCYRGVNIGDGDEIVLVPEPATPTPEAGLPVR